MKRAGTMFLVIYRLLAGAIVAAAAAVVLLLLLGFHPYAVRTGSMEPTVPTGSLCFVNRRTAFEEIQAGDIVAFRMGELMVIHRAVRISGTGITTKGDANSAEDAEANVTQANYIGKTVFWIPGVGKVLLFVHTGSGRFAAAGAIALFLAAGVVYDKIKARYKTTEA